MAMDFGLFPQGRVHTDSSAAIGIASRSGLGGKARHIQVQYLWIQEKVKSGKLEMRKVDTKKNVADLLTKSLGTELFETHVQNMGFIFMDGRAGEAVSINGVVPYSCPHGYSNGVVRNSCPHGYSNRVVHFPSHMAI